MVQFLENEYGSKKGKYHTQPLDHQSAEVATRLVKMIADEFKKELTGHDAKEFLDDKGNGKYQLDPLESK